MPRPLRIDFVSDISCPWCIIGLRGLEEALARSGDALTAEIHFQPFELNPGIAPEGGISGSTSPGNMARRRINWPPIAR